MENFIPGLELGGRFFHEAVKPLLELHFPGLEYSAARLDQGSDVLGFDTPRSMDHDWGPKFSLFLREDDFEGLQGRIGAMLGQELPSSFLGFPVSFSLNSDGTRKPDPAAARPLRHGVTLTTPPRFFKAYLGLDPLEGLGARAWLSLPQQKLCTIASGRVFHDGLEALGKARKALAWYPHDIWLHLLACQWRRIDQEEPFMARCGDLGDELGSRLLGAKLSAEIMKLCFLMEKRYAPYSKWFGTAFARLECAPGLAPLLKAVLECGHWKEREEALGRCYLFVLKMHNALGITPPVEAVLAPFFSRPYLVPRSGRVVEALCSKIVSEEVKKLPAHIGNIDQITDSVDVLSSAKYHLGLLGIVDAA